MQVQRSDPTSIAKDHEARIRALERAPSAPVFVDSRVLAAAADRVLFTGFPSRTILELSWFALAEDGPGVVALLFNGDATENDPFFDEEEYRWTIGVPYEAIPPPGTYPSIANNTEAGVVSWISNADTSSGRIRFPAYDVVGPDENGRGGEWHGDVAVSNGSYTNPAVSAGFRDDVGQMNITSIALIALTDPADADARQNFAAGSWFALTAT